MALAGGSETPQGNGSRVSKLITRLTPSGSSRSLASFQSPVLDDVDADADADASIEAPKFVSDFMQALAPAQPPPNASPPTSTRGLQRSASLLASPSHTARASPTAKQKARHSEEGIYSKDKRASVGSYDTDRRSVGVALASTWNRSRDSLGLTRTKSKGDLLEQASESSKTPGPSTSASWSRAARPGVSRGSSDEGLPTLSDATSLSHRTPGAGTLGTGLSESSKRFRSAFRLKSRDQHSTLRKPMRATADSQSMTEDVSSSSPDTPPAASGSEPERSSPEDEIRPRPGSSLSGRYRAADASSLARAQLVEEPEPAKVTRPSLDASRGDTLRPLVSARQRPMSIDHGTDRSWMDMSRPSSRASARSGRLSDEVAAIAASTRSPSPELAPEPEAPRPLASVRAALSQQRLQSRTNSPEVPEARPPRASPPTFRPLADQNENGGQQQPAKKRSFQTLEDRRPLADLGARMNNISLHDASLVADKRASVVTEYRVPLKGGSVSPPEAPAPSMPPPAAPIAVPAVTVAAPGGQPQPLAAVNGAPPPRKSNSSTVVVNGKPYLRSALLGKGGSSRVYRITDREHNVFALKRVELGKGDLETYHSFCNEIELLKRLRGHDRIIQLVDSEVNEAKRTLIMILEIGEIDLNSLLQERASARVSMNFIRYMWEQMLEAVIVVHDAGIVHTDLKPANFVLVKGALKLIDFGIAKAIPSDTTNIARDQQIGTANYMSPEALSDSGMGRGGERMMKMGRASDVWSLGCILYQMVYGTTPFGHLRNLQQKMLAIQNPMHVIEYGDYAIPRAGGVEQHALATPVEADLVKVLRSCLRFEAKKRATIPDLLEDTFLRRESNQRRREASGERPAQAAELSPQALSSVVSRVVRWSAGRQPTRTEQQQFIEVLVRQLSAEGV